MISLRAALSAVALFAFVLAPGCGGPAKSPSAEAGRSRTGTGNGQFPSARDLEGLAEAPAPDPFPPVPAIDVETWELVGPFPERIAAVTDLGETPWDSLLATEAGNRAGLVVPTEAMRCVAHEVGVFHLAHQAEPNHSLRGYIGSRCYTSVPTFRFATIYASIPSSVTDAAIFEQWQEAFSARISELVRGGASTAGVWFGREGDRVVAVVAAGTRQVHLEPVSPIPGSDGHIRLQGEILSSVVTASAIVTRGKLGFGYCTPDPTVSLPRFAFDCDMNARDASAIVSVGYTAPGRLIGAAGLHMLVWPSGRPTATYHRPSYTKKREAKNAADARAEFVDALNDLRDDAGLGPLIEAQAQSETASVLAPHYFAAVLGVTPETDADLVALGLIAGWNVEGILQSGHFTTAWVPQTNDVGRLLSEMLSHPVGRSVLLASDVDQIAVGALVDTDPENPALAAIIGTYGIFSEAAHAANAKRVYGRFQSQRAGRGFPAAGRLEEIEALSVEAAGSVQAGATPAIVLDQLLEASSAVLQRAVVGWIAEVSDLDDLEFPDEFLNRSNVAVAISVSHRQPEDEPWGRYVVLLVAAEPAGHRI